MGQVVDMYGRSVLDVAVPGRPDWENKVAAECMEFAKAVSANFETCIKNSSRYLPDQKDPEQRKIQISYHFEVLASLHAQILARFGSIEPDFEEITVGAIKHRFAYLRGQYAAYLAANPGPAESPPP